MSILSGLVMLTIFGISLIWKGITGDVMTTPMGDRIVPGWMYILAGLILLLFPLANVLIRSETGRALLGF